MSNENMEQNHSLEKQHSVPFRALAHITLRHANVLCCLVPSPLHHETPDTDTLTLAHASRRQSPPLCERRKENINAPGGPFISRRRPSG